MLSFEITLARPWLNLTFVHLLHVVLYLVDIIIRRQVFFQRWTFTSTLVLKRLNFVVILMAEKLNLKFLRHKSIKISKRWCKMKSKFLCHEVVFALFKVNVNSDDKLIVKFCHPKIGIKRKLIFGVLPAHFVDRIIKQFWAHILIVDNFIIDKMRLIIFIFKLSFHQRCSLIWIFNYKFRIRIVVCLCLVNFAFLIKKKWI